jgi:predicted alpha/beta superfamily hydrolase
MKKIFLILFIVGLFIQAKAQYARVDIPGSETRKISSSIVTGQEYELQILLPGSHKNSNKKFPVVYLMDSQWDFPLLKSLYGQHYYDGFIPELIIVGVTWTGTWSNADSLRARDYTPTNEGRLKQSGGADRFLSFMKKELFPFIESNYKASGENRTLMGCSLGGLITLYALFTQPELFTGYAAASPAIGWDREVLYKYEKEFSQKKLPHPVRVYMTIGDVERSLGAYERFAATMTNRNYPGANVVSRILENTGHSGTKTETFGRGLQYIFERPKLKLDEAVLKNYSGSYEQPNGSKIELKSENGSLVLYYSPTNKYSLYASDQSCFYATSEFLNIQFKMNVGRPEGFQLNRYGSSQFFKRVN